MRKESLFLYLFLALMLVSMGCNPVLVETRHQFDERDRVKTFGFTESSNQLNINEYNRNLLKTRVTKELEARGYLLTESDPDFWVNLDIMVKRIPINVGYRNKKNEQNLVYDKEVGLRDPGDGQYVDAVGKILIDLLNNDRTKIMWHAEATQNVDRPDQNSLSIINAVEKMFKKLPR